MVSQSKQLLVSSLCTDLQKANHVVVIRFHKTKHQTLEMLRKSLKQVHCAIKVVKNTLFGKAIRKVTLQKPEFKSLADTCLPLRDQCAILLFDNDWSTGLKCFYEFTKKEPTLSFKVGIIDKNIYNSQTLITLASIPPYDVLLQTVIITMKTPVKRLVHALTFHPQKFMYILTQKANQK